MLQGGPEERPGDDRGQRGPATAPSTPQPWTWLLVRRRPSRSMASTSGRVTQAEQRAGAAWYASRASASREGQRVQAFVRHTRSFPVDRHTGSPYAGAGAPARAAGTAPARPGSRSAPAGWPPGRAAGRNDVLVDAQQRAERRRDRRRSADAARPRRPPLALVLLLHTAPSGSVHIRVVQAQPAPMARPIEQLGGEQRDATPCGGRASISAGLAQRHDGRGWRAAATSAGRCRSGSARNCRTITRTTTATISSALTSPDITASVSEEGSAGSDAADAFDATETAGREIGAGWITGGSLRTGPPPTGGDQPAAPAPVRIAEARSSNRRRTRPGAAEACSSPARLRRPTRRCATGPASPPSW